MRELSARWAITLVAPGEPPPEVASHQNVAAPGLSYPWRFDPSALADSVRRALDGPFQNAVVWPGAETAWLMQRGAPTAVMDMIDCNPLEFWRGVRAEGTWRDRLRSLSEVGVAARSARRAVRRFAATTCVGEQDAAWLRRLGSRETVFVVPNGVALPAHVPAEAANPMVCFTGTLDYPPNVDAVRYLTLAVWPLVRSAVPQARLVLAGRHATDEVRAFGGRDGVVMAADVADMTEIIGTAWVSVAPMRIGVGIKNKVLEAWACGRPAVLSPLATNGLVLPIGHERLVGESAGSMAGAVVRLLQNEGWRRSLGNAAREHAARECGWDRAAERMEACFVSRRSTASAPPSNA